MKITQIPEKQMNVKEKTDQIDTKNIDKLKKERDLYLQKQKSPYFISAKNNNNNSYNSQKTYPRSNLK